MGEPQPTAPCPVCGTRAQVDPRTGTVRPHLRKGGVPCEGKQKARGLRRVLPSRRQRVAETEEVPDMPAGLVRIRTTCPECGRFCSVGEEDFRIRRHRNRANKVCRGSLTVPEVDSLKLDGISVAEAKRRRRAALAGEGGEGAPKGFRARMAGLFSRSRA